MSKKSNNNSNYSSGTEVKSMKKNVGIRVLVIIASISMIIYIVWRAIFTIPDVATYGWITFFCGIFLWIAEALSLAEALANYKELSQYELPEMPIIPTACMDEFFPEVDIFIATHNEETQLLFKTVNACTRIKYPFKDRVHVYICDDTKRAEVEELAATMGVGYFGISDNKLMKAGNLNNAIRQTKSPLIVTFDADMIPNSEFLLETVPYFALPKFKKDENGVWVKKSQDEIDENERMGFVQTPQTFYNPDLFQYNLYSEDRVPNEQDYFFRHVNSGKNHTNSPIYAGSNTVISREALEKVGLIATGTITEDFETGLKIQMEGYTCIAIDKPLAKGLAPTSVKALIKQRERWARGCIFSLRRIHLLLNRKITWGQKFSYGACRLYWGTFTRRLAFIMAPLLYVLLDIPVVICGIKGLLIFWLPANLLHSIALKKVSGGIRNARWSNTIDTILFPHMIIPIWSEALGIKKKKFEVTNKKREIGKDDSLYLAIPHIVLLILSIIALFIAVKMIVTDKNSGTLIVIYWLVINCFSLIMSIFFMVGRRNERETERFTVSLPMSVFYNNNKYEGMVSDISEGGFAFDMQEAVFLPHGKDKEKIGFNLHNTDYSANVYGYIVNVRQIKETGVWRYCVQICEMNEENTKEYMQLVYDRVHTLPMLLTNKTSYFEDLENNVSRRMKGRTASRRELPRITVNERYKTLNGDNVKILDFNFECVRLNVAIENDYAEKITQNKSDAETESVEIIYPGDVTILLGNNCRMICKLLDNRKGLYQVVNRMELDQSSEFKNIVNKWMKKNN